MLSGIQHFVFCRRQWALIHIEQQWAENGRTIDGKLMHRTAHDEMRVEKRGNQVITRGMRVVSHRLGVSGICDVVEFRRNENGIEIPSWSGRWKPYPVEYKKGVPKDHDADELQLCLQAICLEEMLCCNVEEGSLYYGETRRRKKVEFSGEMRHRVEELLREMHNLYRRGWTPKVNTSNRCRACSLKEICIPKLSRSVQVSTYINRSLEGGE